MKNIRSSMRDIQDFKISIRVRDKNGVPQHKADFPMNKERCLIEEVKLWKDKFGVRCVDIAAEFKKQFIREEIKDETKKLNEFREKTRLLREPDKELQDKMRKAL